MSKYMPGGLSTGLPKRGAAHMKAQHPEFEDGPMDLCERSAEAVGLLSVCQLHVPQEPVLRLWAGDVCQRPGAAVHPIGEPAQRKDIQMKSAVVEGTHPTPRSSKAMQPIFGIMDVAVYAGPALEALP